MSAESGAKLPTRLTVPSTSGRPELLFATGSTYPKFAEQAVAGLNTQLVPLHVDRFKDGELRPSFAGKLGLRSDLTIFQTAGYSPEHTHWSPNDALMELSLIARAARSHVHSITAFMSYMPYGRSDETAYSNAEEEAEKTAIAAKFACDMLAAAGIDKLATFDAHADQMIGFFTGKVERLTTLPLLTAQIQPLVDMYGPTNLVAVAPRTGGSKPAKKLAKQLGIDLAFVDVEKDHSRDKNGEPVVNLSLGHFIGEVANRHAIILDDIVHTAAVALFTENVLHNEGVLSTRIVAPHALLTADAARAIRTSRVTELITTNTTSQARTAKILPKSRFKVINIAPYAGQLAERIHQDDSMSSNAAY